MGRILIFGGYGFVGGNLAVAAQRCGWDVAVADSVRREGLAGVERLDADIADVASVRAAVRAAQPEAVVNVAAVADIDKAEQNRELAWKVNVEGAGNVAEACRETGAKYVFFSSDAVFDGKAALYSEEDAPDPVNFYGRTKAEAEKAVQAACPASAVIRISLVLGLPVTGGNSFVGALKEKLAGGAEILCPIDEVRTPLDVHTLCAAVLELASNDFAGILHIAGTESVDRYALARRLAAGLGFDESLVRLKPAGEDASGRAPRHKNGIISVEKAQRVLKTPMLNLEQTIQRALE